MLKPTLFPAILLLSAGCLFAQTPAATPVAVQPETAPVYQAPPAVDPAVAADPLYVRARRADALFKYHPDRAYGTLDVTTSTPDAAFYLGPWYVDRTPIANLKLYAGNFEYRTRLRGYQEVTGAVTLQPNEKAALNLSNPKKKGGVLIKTTPEGVQVSLGNKPFGTTNAGGLQITDLSAGTYTVKLARAGFQTQERTLKVIDGEKNGISAWLSENYGSLRVECPIPETPSFVYANNIYWGRTPITLDHLRPGKTVVRVEQENYAPFLKTLIVKSDEVTSVTATLQKDRSYTNISPYGKLEGSWGDKDGDGIPNDLDKCPEDPEDLDGFQENDGCPDADNDYDGLSDIKEKDNKYRDMAEDVDGFQDNDGVPDFDNDSDNIPDSVDLCPGTPEDRDGFEELDGCPDLDNDADGVPDSADIAPMDPEDKDGFQDTDGAPDLDNDNDGIKDYMDACSKEAEIYNNFQDDDGCPDEKIAEPRMGTLALMVYDPKSPDLPLAFFDQLDSVYNALIAYPNALIEIKVHSDNRGKPSNKIAQTEERAQIIRRYLGYRQRVPAYRYQVMSLGGSDPIASNTSQEGRDRNTRLELKRVK
ncbi:MAG: OmpA family protein [Fibrobacterota bacterium]